MTRAGTPRRPRRPARRNVSRREREARRQARRRAAASLLQGLALAAVALFAGCLFVFAHDMLVQSGAFRARTIAVEGLERLSRPEILAQAGIRAGANVLAVNLAAARKRLLAHPWVAEAEVRRELPDALHIRIREHRPAAVVALAGEKFLLSDRGELFKEWEAADPAGLPAVVGLKAADLPVADRAAAAAGRPAPAPLRSRALDAVWQVLSLGREPRSPVPNRQLRAIQVDPELGLTLIAFEEEKAIRIGFDDYPEKYRLLAELTAFLQGQADFNDFARADLNDPARVIVQPTHTAPRLAGR
jgi:cell division protein FtsQ